MKLLTKELEDEFKKIGTQEDVEDPIVICKFFDPCGSWTWYAYSWSPEDGLFFGLVKGFETELGYFSLAELEGYKGKMGLGIERDLYFDKCKLSEIWQKDVRT